jgi:hypothetical protein
MSTLVYMTIVGTVTPAHTEDLKRYGFKSITSLFYYPGYTVCMTTEEFDKFLENKPVWMDTYYSYEEIKDDSKEEAGATKSDIL